MFKANIFKACDEAEAAPTPTLTPALTELGLVDVAGGDAELLFVVDALEFIVAEKFSISDRREPEAIGRREFMPRPKPIASG